MPLDYWDKPPRRWCEEPLCTREHWVGHGVCWFNPGQIQAEAIKRERRDQAARAFLAGFWGMAPVMVVVIVLLYWTGVLG